MAYPTLAGDRDASYPAAPQLFAGQSEVITESAPALAAIAQWEVCVLTATGVTPWVVATHGAIVPDKLVVAQVAVASGQQCPFYSAGKFNHAVLKWPATINTFALRKEAVQGSMVQVGHLI
jgi:hypothetical protein